MSDNDNPFKDATVDWIELVEWTSEMAEEIAQIKSDPTPVTWIYSLPKKKVEEDQ